MVPAFRKLRPWVPMWLVIVLLVNLGIFSWVWLLYQKNRERYDAAGLTLAHEPPAAEPAEPPSQLYPVPLAVQDSLPRRESPPSREPPPRPSPPAAASVPQAAPPAVSTAVAQAVPPPAAPFPVKRKTEAEDFYFGLLRSERFKKSQVIDAWVREFLSYPDLRMFNHRYHVDGDAFKFLCSVSRSGNFHGMLGKYMKTPDVQGFITAMAGSPAVASSAHAYMADSGVRAVAQKAGLAGLVQGQPAGQTRR